MRSLPLLLVLAACVSDKEASVLQEILDASFSVQAPEGVGTCHDGTVTLTGTIDARYAGQELGSQVTVGDATFQRAVPIEGDGSWAVDIGEQAVCAEAGGCTLDITVVMETTDELDDAPMATTGSTTLTLTDDGTIWFVDADGDGFGGTDTVSSCAATPPPGSTDVEGDCDDTTASRSPDAAEQCNGIDDDCDTVIDNDLTFVDYYPDLDGDTYGDADAPATSTCDGPPAGGAWVTDATDCNDDPKTGSASYPGADEICDGGEDNDCDGLADDLDQADLVGTPTYYLDEDGDTYFSTEGVGACTPPVGNYTDTAPAQGQGDCNDADDSISPGALEVCDGVDNDCDTFIDDDDPSTTGEPVWHTDADDDGVPPSAYSVVQACNEPPGYSAPSVLVDCDDTDPVANPLDLDGDGYDTCSGLIDCDDADPALNQDDLDSDGWTTCTDDCDDNVASLNPADADNDGVSTCDGDCNDNANNISPLLTDVPGDLIDQDCDTFLDCFVDQDGDGYGSAQVREDAAIDGAETCSTVIGVSATDDDCDDADFFVSPGAAEQVGNNVDEDCDTRLACYEDSDDDGHGGTATASATADIADGCDNTYGLALTSDDCDDGDADAYPGAPEAVADGTDQDCDGFDACYDDNDDDGDGSTTIVSAGANVGAGQTCATTGGVADNSDDCNDNNDQIYTGATELVASNVDEDCDGFDACYDDGDGDGYGTASTVAAGALLPGESCAAKSGVSATSDDCNDSNDQVSPGATEVVVNGVDDNCDGREGCYIDGDGDAFGNGADLTAVAIGDSCASPGFAAVDDDCDDNDSTRFPGATELYCDGVLQDCDGTFDSVVRNTTTGTNYTGAPATQLETAVSAASDFHTIEVCALTPFDEEVSLAIDKSLTIDGAGAILRAAPGERVVSVSGAATSATLSDMILVGSGASVVDDGGLALVDGNSATLRLESVDLIDGATDGDGGAVMVRLGTLDWASGTCQDGFAAGNGGCVSVGAGEAFLGDGAAVDFTSNAAAGDGGAIYVAAGADLQWNQGSCDGGGLVNAANGGCLAGPGSATLSDVTLTGATAGSGGALHSTGSVEWLLGECSGNTATGGIPTSYGGCVYVGSLALVQLGSGVVPNMSGPDTSNNDATIGEMAYVSSNATLQIAGGLHSATGGDDVVIVGTGEACWTGSERFDTASTFRVVAGAVASLYSDYSCAPDEYGDLACTASAASCGGFFP